VIIDAHAHIGEGNQFLEYWWNVNLTPELIIKLDDQAGVDKSVIFPCHYKDYSVGNREVAEAVKKYPTRFIPFAKVNCSDINAVNHLIEAVEKFGAKGLKLHSREGGGFPTKQILDKVTEYDIPVLIHTKGPLELDPMLRAYPDLKIIIAHLGGPWDHEPELCAIHLAERYDNVYLDTSLSLWRNLKLAVERVGVEKIVFGSDAPEFHPAVERRKIEILNLGSKEENMILGGNILRLLKLG
jgi:hypothetical protein